MFWARHKFLKVTSLLCFLAGIRVDFIRVSAQFVNTICGEEEWQHDGQENELMCNLIILPARRGYCPRGLLCLHHVWSITFPKRQKKTSETKKNSPVVFVQITHQTSFDCSIFFFKLPTQQGRCSPVVDLQDCLCFSFLVFKPPYYQCSFPPTVLLLDSTKVPESSCTQHWYLNRKFPPDLREMKWKWHTSLLLFYKLHTDVDYSLPSFTPIILPLLFPSLFSSALNMYLCWALSSSFSRARVLSSSTFQFSHSLEDICGNLIQKGKNSGKPTQLHKYLRQAMLTQIKQMWRWKMLLAAEDYLDW